MSSTGQTTRAGQSIIVKVDGSNIQITLQGHGQGQAVGWGAVEDAVRSDDERQVQSCKEDIDSLLTFAGLYSAALTALLALSFGMLQEDTGGESLQVLRQIALQTASYSILPGGALNTTAIVSPTSSSPFVPSRAALRINILWFASLVFSLATASIGILVKQWLCAYTSYQTSSAQGRMRVRYFRHQGMETWKVYEIAALLPYLIQVALGLFFVGLCYFTAGVHPDLGHATLPLVAGWALFIFVVTILPIFSSYCPFKPALFEGLFSVIRRRLFTFAETLFVLIDGYTRTPFSRASRKLDVLAGYIRELKLRIATRSPETESNNLFSERDFDDDTTRTRLQGDSIARSRRRPSPVLSKHFVLVAGCIRRSSALVGTTYTQFTRLLKQRLPLCSRDEEALNRTFCGRLALWARRRTPNCRDCDRPRDEDDAVKYGGKDTDVLVFADAMQSDDELLGTAIVDAMKHSQHTIKDIAVFVVGVLQSRNIVESSMEGEPPSTWLNCRSLTPCTATAIADVVVQHHHLIRYDSPSHSCRWLYRTLLSLPRPLPAGGLFLDMMAYFDESKRLWNFKIQAILQRSSKPPDQSLRLSLSAFKLFWISKYLPSETADSASEILSNAYWCVSRVLEAALKYAGLSDVTLSEGYTDNPLERRMSFDDFPLQDTIEWMAGLVHQEVESKQEETDDDFVRDSLELIFRLSRLDFISCSSQRAMLSWDIQATLMHDCSKYCIENSVEGLQWAIWCYAQNPAEMMWPQAKSGYLTLKQHVHFADEGALRRLYHAVADFDVGDVSASNKPAASARVCYIIVHILDDAAPEKMTASLVRLWRRILRYVTLMLSIPGEYHTLSKPATTFLVRRCLWAIARLDRGVQYASCEGDEAKKQEWQNNFKPENSPFSNHFVFLLSRLLSNKDRASEARNCWRLHVVEDMFKEDEDAVLKDDQHDDDEEISEKEDGDGGDTNPPDNEVTDACMQSHPEKPGAEQSGLIEVVGDVIASQSSNGTEPHVIAAQATSPETGNAWTNSISNNQATDLQGGPAQVDGE